MLANCAFIFKLIAKTLKHEKFKTLFFPLYIKFLRCSIVKYISTLRQNRQYVSPYRTALYCGSRRRWNTEREILLLNFVGSDKFGIPHEVCLIFNQLNIIILRSGHRDVLFLPDGLKI